MTIQIPGLPHPSAEAVDDRKTIVGATCVYSDLSEAISIEKRYFTSDFSSLS
jgi:hypothetical protein